MRNLLTLCHDTVCPVREHCQRSPASGTVPHPHTSWFLASPRTLAGCAYFEPETATEGRTSKRTPIVHQERALQGF